MIVSRHINPKAIIGEDYKIKNLGDFKSIDEVFDTSCFKACQPLNHDYYGSSKEHACYKCHDLEMKIREANKGE